MTNNNKKKKNLLIEKDTNTIDWVDDCKSSIVDTTPKKIKKLSPIKHPQQDFFIADLFDMITLQLDQKSMELPLFALKTGDKRPRYFEQGGLKIAITASSTYGLATIHDKDIWIYCVSKIMQAIRETSPTNRTVHFTIYDYLKTTNRDTGGIYYERTKDSLNRMSGTRIEVEYETDKKKEARGFGLIDSWKIVEEKDGRMIRVSVTLPEWLYESTLSTNVLTLSPDYFRIRKPLERRIYELARKHCGNNASWTFNLKTLHERSGSTTSLREFRRSIKLLAESNHLPDYLIEFNQNKDQVIFVKRIKTIEEKVIVLEEKHRNTKPKRKKISEYEAGLLARPGEEWPDLLKRIGSEYEVIFNKKTS